MGLRLGLVILGHIGNSWYRRDRRDGWLLRGRKPWLGAGLRACGPDTDVILTCEEDNDYDDDSQQHHHHQERIQGDRSGAWIRDIHVVIVPLNQP